MTCSCRRHALCWDCLERAEAARYMRLLASDFRERLIARLHSVHVDRMPLHVLPWPPERQWPA